MFLHIATYVLQLYSDNIAVLKYSCYVKYIYIEHIIKTTSILRNKLFKQHFVCTVGHRASGIEFQRNFSVLYPFFFPIYLCAYPTICSPSILQYRICIFRFGPNTFFSQIKYKFFNVEKCNFASIFLFLLRAFFISLIVYPKYRILVNNFGSSFFHHFVFYYYENLINL